MDLELMAEAVPRLASGIDETLLLVAGALGAGFVLAVLAAVASLSRHALPRHAAGAYVYLFRSTPLLIQIFLIYYGSGQFRGTFEALGLWWLFRESWFCAIFAFALNTGAYAAVVFEGAVRAVPRGQIEAARAIGMSPLQVFLHIRWPIALRTALPAYSNEAISMLKGTSLASTVTIVEVTAIAKDMIGETYRPFEIFIVAGAIYLGLVFLMTRGFRLAERRLGRHLAVGTAGGSKSRSRTQASRLAG